MTRRHYESNVKLRAATIDTSQEEEDLLYLRDEDQGRGGLSENCQGTYMQRKTLLQEEATKRQTGSATHKRDGTRGMVKAKKARDGTLSERKDARSGTE
jgi:hypothetical protein